MIRVLRICPILSLKKYKKLQKVFTTVPESSVNSWDSWFIYNLQKNKHLLLHDTFVHGNGLEDILLLQVSLRIHRQRNHCDFLDVNFLSNTCNRMGNKLKFLFTIST
jgi:hypothetical protein